MCYISPALRGPQCSTLAPSVVTGKPGVFLPHFRTMQRGTSCHLNIYICASSDGLAIQIDSHNWLHLLFFLQSNCFSLGCIFIPHSSALVQALSSQRMSSICFAYWYSCILLYTDTLHTLLLLIYLYLFSLVCQVRIQRKHNRMGLDIGVSFQRILPTWTGNQNVING